MPLTWIVDHAAKQIVATASGTLVQEDVARYLQALPAEGAVGYRAIFDVGAASVRLSPTDLKSFSQLVQSRKADGFDGAIALVVNSNAEREIASYFAARTEPSRLARLFDSVSAAKAWFATLDAEGSEKPPGET